MKHLKHLLAALVFVSLIIFTNCGGGGGGGNNVDPLEAQADKLVGSWVLDANGGEFEGASLGSEWDGFTLTITVDSDNAGGDYTTNSPCADVFPTSGSWEFANANGQVVTRDGEVDINITLTTTKLTMAFELDEGTCTAARTDAANSAAGTYNFAMTKN